MKDLRDLTYFLGIYIIWDQNIHTIFINQINYISKILVWFNIENYKSAKILLELNIKINKLTELEPYNI